MSLALLQTDTNMVVLSLEGKPNIVWDAIVFSHTRLRKSDQVFRELNGYWSRLCREQQLEIWNVYSDIRKILNTVLDLRDLKTQLSEAVARLYAVMPYEDVVDYIKNHKTLTYPELKDEYDEDERNHDRTYLRRDYDELIQLAAGVRCMLPIWAEYIKLIKDDSGTTHKELASMHLLSAVQIQNVELTTEGDEVCDGKFRSFLELRAIKRLRRFIESTAGAKTASTGTLASGLGSDEYCNVMLAQTIVRRLAVGDLDAEERCSLITMVWGFVDNSIRNQPRAFPDVKEKFSDAPGRDETDERSRAEGHRTAQKIPEGILVFDAYYVTDIHNHARKLDPTISTTLVNSCIAAARDIPAPKIPEFVISICQMVVDGRSIAAQAIYNMTVAERFCVVVAVQATLWHWGFHTLAIMLTAKPVTLAKQTIATPVGWLKSTKVAELDKMFPHHVGDRSGGRAGNVAYKQVMQIAGQIRNHANYWTVYLPQGIPIPDRSLFKQDKLQTPTNAPDLIYDLVHHLYSEDV